MAISDCLFVEKYFHYTEINSTNTIAKQFDTFPVSGIFVFHADVQTQGRGQRGNSFFSGKGGLYATIVCPLSNIENHFVLNRALSLAIWDSIHAETPDAGLFIKWPNDILWNDKKLCGILLESITRSKRHLAVGFGINVNTEVDRFPQDLRKSATSIYAETGKRFDQGKLLEEICTRFQKYRLNAPAKVHVCYCEKLYKIGASVGINGQRGIFKSVLEDGRLCLDSGGTDTLHSSGSLCFLPAGGG
jgi:BirA family transcriptional regulator, biotin operon repressor / biotin---[acetyl-CoA-carboxylase] ligase